MGTVIRYNRSKRLSPIEKKLDPVQKVNNLDDIEKSLIAQDNVVSSVDNTSSNAEDTCGDFVEGDGLVVCDNDTEPVLFDSGSNDGDIPESIDDRLVDDNLDDIDSNADSNDDVDEDIDEDIDEDMDTGDAVSVKSVLYVMDDKDSSGRNEESNGSLASSDVSDVKQAPVRRNKKKMNPWLRLLIKCAIIGVVVWALLTFVLGIHIYHGENMYPFIMDGDFLVTYKLDSYNVGDVVAYKVPGDQSISFSRISALGEHLIDISGGLMVDGYLSADKTFYETTKVDGSGIEFPYKTKSDDYFLLDDYRLAGRDSRVFGSLTKQDLCGKVIYVLRKRGI